MSGFTFRHVSPDTKTKNGQRVPDIGARPGIKLRAERFDLMTRVVGISNDYARRRALGVDEKTIRRARQGADVGHRFIANTLWTLKQEPHVSMLAQVRLEPTFDELFEVVADQQEVT